MVETPEAGHSPDRTRDGERVGAVSVTKYSPFWSERFQFVSAVKLDSDATCIHVLPFSKSYADTDLLVHRSIIMSYATLVFESWVLQFLQPNEDLVFLVDMDFWKTLAPSN
ncbi:hypothetical protein BDE02_02G235800 [Populus trichocarpa]|jgi:hypothetical protein|nr:hypothetical protein BDE02_02G235800 [Populus trichocarpa]